MLELHADQDHLVVDPQGGGRITSLVAGGRPRLVDEPAPPLDPEDTVQWGCFVMAPWAGRIRDAMFIWDGGTAHLPARVQGNALHGLAMDQPWTVESSDPTSATLVCDLATAPWPFTGARVVHRLSLAPGALDLGLEVTAGPQPMPSWVGWHPCFRRPEHGDVHLKVDAPATLVVDERTVPTGALAPVTAATDLRGGDQLAERRLDDAFVDVQWPVTVSWPDLELSMTADGADTVVVFTPPHEVCVEPQSGWPDAVHLADRHGADRVGLATIQPHRTRTTSTTWTWRPPPG